VTHHLFGAAVKGVAREGEEGEWNLGGAKRPGGEEGCIGFVHPSNQRGESYFALYRMVATWLYSAPSAAMGRDVSVDVEAAVDTGTRDQQTTAERVLCHTAAFSNGGIVSLGGLGRSPGQKKRTSFPRWPHVGWPETTVVGGRWWKRHETRI
jgi:hypothetical protein